MRRSEEGGRTLNNSIKLSGMVSGLDTDTIIKQLMKIERAPLDKLTQEKQKIAWKRDEYREMNTMLSSLRTLTDKLRFSTSFNKQSASSSDTSIVTATASSAASSGSFTIKVNALATSALVTGSSLGVTDLKSTVGTSGQITVEGTGGKKVNVDLTAGVTSYNTIINTVNNANIGVKMSFDSINSRFMLTNTATGESSTLQVSGSGVAALGLTEMTQPQVGSNAEVEVNGQPLTMEKNAFELNGVRFDLKGVSTNSTTVTVTKDTSNVVDQIKGFVEEYNKLVDQINLKTKAIPSRSYTPLTDEQKEGMTEKQIELWEGKAKIGLLYRDDILQDTLNTLKMSLLKKVDTKISTPEGMKDVSITISDIGLSFKAFKKGAVGELGKLELDETKLKDVLDKDPNLVTGLFTASSPFSKLEPEYKMEHDGIGERVYDTLFTQMNKIFNRIGNATASDAADTSQLGSRIRDINSRMDIVKYRLQNAEDRYYKQFTAMEMALQKLNSKGSWLASQLGN